MSMIDQLDLYPMPERAPVVYCPFGCGHGSTSFSDLIAHARWCPGNIFGKSL